MFQALPFSQHDMEILIISPWPPCAILKIIRKIIIMDEGFHSKSNAVYIQVVSFVLFVFFWNSVQLFLTKKKPKKFFLMIMCQKLGTINLRTINEKAGKETLIQ